MISLAQYLYDRLRRHESFDMGEWEGLMSGQRAHVDGAASGFIRELQRRYRDNPRLRGNWLDESRQAGLFDGLANMDTLDPGEKPV